MKKRIVSLVLVSSLLLLNSCGHSHAFSDDYSFDKTQHWYQCECGEKTGATPHRFDSGRLDYEPNEDGNYVKTYTCLDCGATKNEYYDASVTWYSGEQVDLD